MPRKHESNLSQSSNIDRAKKVARFNETFPQAELRRLEQAKREAAHRAAETPHTHTEQYQARRQRHAEYLATQRLLRHPSSPKLGVFSRQLTWCLREIQKPLKQLNLANALLLKGHNSDV
ncbi:hypothetical protein TNCV_848021 [Trichonephila clavipes]|uniref:Uncharacterized protein n=1 Tax=Trichonephila clavipes TaxID=2585209 RepID=A0A8X6RPH0_TRICX|nr:hypothetical protein TNCV_848021 [Trichonephila clavipes]